MAFRRDISIKICHKTNKIQRKRSSLIIYNRKSKTRVQVNKSSNFRSRRRKVNPLRLIVMAFNNSSMAQLTHFIIFKTRTNNHSNNPSQHQSKQQ